MLALREVLAPVACTHGRCLKALHIVAAVLDGLRHEGRLQYEPVWGPGEVPSLLQNPVDGGDGVPAAALPQPSQVGRSLGRQLCRLGRRATGGIVSAPANLPNPPKGYERLADPTGDTGARAQRRLSGNFRVCKNPLAQGKPMKTLVARCVRQRVGDKV
jgi:hypothetical protein